MTPDDVQLLRRAWSAFARGDVHDAGKRYVLTVRTQAPAKWGHSDEPHGEVVAVRDGR